MNEFTIRKTTRVHSSALFVGAALMLLILTFSLLDHNSLLREKAAHLQAQTQMESAERTVIYQKRELAALQTQVTQQREVINDRERTISTQVGTITTQTQLLEAVKTGLQKAREDHPFWSMVLDAIIRFLVELGCSWLSVLL